MLAALARDVGDGDAGALAREQDRCRAADTLFRS
jgi:hypothetical protein